MTGFGAATAACGDGWSLDVEVRSVNARFLEVKLRHPFGGAVEHALRKQVGERLGRGRVEVSIALRRGAPDGGASLEALGLSAARVDTVLAAIEEVARRARPMLEVSAINPSEILRILVASDRGVAADREPPEELSATVERALAELVAFRRREGDALTVVLSDQLDALQGQLDALLQSLPAEGERIAAQLSARLADLTGRIGGDVVVDRDRVAQEVALLLVRGDVTEEVDRIRSHLAQARAVCRQPAAAGQGRTLEFLAQELFREITTIGSKITSHDGSRIVIDAKGTIERIREQVQNVE